MELSFYLAILWRRKWIVFVTTFVTVAVVVAGTLMMPSIYTASATLRVLASEGSADWLQYDTDYTNRLMNTYVEIATSNPVLEELRQRLGLEEPPEVKTEILGNSELLQVMVEDQNPVLAAQAANVLAEILIAQSRTDRRGQGNRLVVIEKAVPPEEPTSPRPELNIALGFMVGLAGGVGLIFLFENLDTTLYTTKQIEAATELPVLGKIPLVKKKHIFFNGTSPEGEAVRFLRTYLLALQPERLDQQGVFKSLLITSAEPREGKSTIVANLAYTMGQFGRNVVVVDGDLRRPTLHELFDLPNEVGLSDVLRQEATLEDVIQDSHKPGVQVLTSGPEPPNSTDLLGSPQMRALIEQLKQQFDLILLDTPALVVVPDAAVLAQKADGVVLVVGRARVRREAVRAACRHLAHVKARSIGVVVNRAEQKGGYDYYHR